MKPKTIYIDIKGGALQGVYGDQLDTEEQIIFVLRDQDNIDAGDTDPIPDEYVPVVHYW